jgi:hypothetical protein
MRIGSCHRPHCLLSLSTVVVSVAAHASRFRNAYAYQIASAAALGAIRPHAVSATSNSRFPLASKAGGGTMSSTTAVASAAASENGTKGAFQRAETVWRNWIGEGAYRCFALIHVVVSFPRAAPPWPLTAACRLWMLTDLRCFPLALNTQTRDFQPRRAGTTCTLRMRARGRTGQ